MVPLHIHIVVKGLWQHAYCDPTSFFTTHILTNDTQELKPYRFKFLTDANRIRKDFAYIEVWTRISRMKDGRISQLCHAYA